MTSKAPEQIWFTSVGKNIVPNSYKCTPEDVEYIRADLHAERITELERQIGDWKCQALYETDVAQAAVDAARKALDDRNGILVLARDILSACDSLGVTGGAIPTLKERLLTIKGGAS